MHNNNPEVNNPTKTQVDEAIRAVQTSSAYSDVPQQLKSLPNWVVWRYEKRNGKETKVPYDTKGAFAKSNDATTWSSFEAAVAAADPFTGGNFNGIGFMLHGTPLVGIDFDGCVDDGVPEPFVMNIISQLGNPYVEITPSGTGLRVFVECPKLPPGTRKVAAKKKGVEKYGAEIYAGSEGGRYLTLTGDRLSGEGIPTVANLEIVHFLISRFADDHFKKLWMGDSSDYENDDSRVDLALLGCLARAFGADREKMERFFNASVPGHRDKWTSRKDYRERTLNVASSGVDKAPEPKVFDDESDVEIVEEPLPQFPNLTGSCADLATAVSPDLLYVLKLMCGMTLIGSLISGRVHLAGSEHIDPRLYTVMIDTKGAGKGGSWERIRQALYPLFADDLHITLSVDSGPALVLKLAQHPRTMLYADELNKTFEIAKTTGSSRNSLFDELLTLYDHHETENTAKKNLDLPQGVRDSVCSTNSASIVVKDGQFSLLGGVQPAIFMSMWQGLKGSANGLQSRFCLVSSGNTSVPEPQRPTDENAVREVVNKIREQVAQFGAGELYLNKELGERIRSWWTERQPEHPKASTRTPAMVLRMLIVLCVTNGQREATAELVEQALAFGDYQIAMAERFMPSDAMTWVAEFENLILAAFRKHGKHGVTLNQLRRYVNPEQHQLIGGFGPFKQAWANLRDTGMVVRVGQTSTRKSDVFMLADNQQKRAA